MNKIISPILLTIAIMMNTGCVIVPIAAAGAVGFLGVAMHEQGNSNPVKKKRSSNNKPSRSDELTEFRIVSSETPSYADRPVGTQIPKAQLANITTLKPVQPPAAKRKFSSDLSLLESRETNGWTSPTNISFEADPPVSHKTNSQIDYSDDSNVNVFSQEDRRSDLLQAEEDRTNLREAVQLFKQFKYDAACQLLERIDQQFLSNHEKEETLFYLALTSLKLREKRMAQRWFSLLIEENPHILSSPLARDLSPSQISFFKQMLY